ncbi:transcriptional regulator, PadR family [Clostridium cavendishii DSM 21758]|uniref:Transcriptional regulator, PadR family n=1 Tax=Clostridium cavendishii DSM 21758 TaxID=1121302 RepID=A0A1M6G898_9CLOT|nr:PadR family transcriptional regulator [Clostridium cavendishii]SHJ06057.1 transcriptional regulator, PadR family [Clostridium cavendishii DSM 21758]
MANTTQLLKGIMEGVILKVIAKEETYGYEIYKKLQTYGFEEFAEGSLYPLLLRLEKNKLIKSEKKQSPLGPDRKYYSLTEDGEREMKEFIGAWDIINVKIQKVWEK